MFLETGTTGTAGMAQFTFGTATTTRTYKIKVTYYRCDSLNRLGSKNTASGECSWFCFRAPAGCVQYFTGTTGTVTSYNYPNTVIDNQNYNTCFRQEQGFCSINYSQSPATGPDTFDLYSDIADTNAQTIAVVSWVKDN